jgi:hypothetical protein
MACRFWFMEISYSTNAEGQLSDMKTRTRTCRVIMSKSHILGCQEQCISIESETFRQSHIALKYICVCMWMRRFLASDFNVKIITQVSIAWPNMCRRGICLTCLQISVNVNPASGRPRYFLSLVWVAWGWWWAFRCPCSMQECMEHCVTVRQSPLCLKGPKPHRPLCQPAVF